jgi:cysteine desulfurase
VPGIVGFGKACEICEAEMPAESVRLRGLRDRLKDAIVGGFRDTHSSDAHDVGTHDFDTHINGSMVHRLPHNLNISFANVESDALLMGISDVAISNGSACTSATIEPSHVLKALGVSDELAHSSIRFGLGRFNTEEEVDYAAVRVVDTVKRLRELSPSFDAAKKPARTAS